MNYPSLPSPEDGNVILLDSASYDSRLYSPELSPEIDDNTIVNILDPAKVEPSGDTPQRSRYKFRNLFKALSWKGKDKSTTVIDTEVSPEEPALYLSFVNDYPSKSTTCKGENIDSFRLSKGDSLYDNSKSLQHLKSGYFSEEDSLNEELKLESELASLSRFPKSATTIDKLECCSITSQTNAKTLSRSRGITRKLSQLSFRLKSKHTARTSTEKQHKKCLESQSDERILLDLLSPTCVGNSSTSPDLNLVEGWRFSDNKVPKLVLEPLPLKMNSDFKSHFVYQTLEEPELGKGASLYTELRNFQEENIEKILYYPFSQDDVDKNYSQNHNYLKITCLEVYEQYNSLFTQDGLDNFNVRSNSLLAIRSLDLPKILELYLNKFSTEDEAASSKNKSIQFLKELYSEEVSFVVNQQSFINGNFSPKVWNIWSSFVKDHTTNQRESYISTKITSYEQQVKIMHGGTNLLDFQSQERGPHIYVLKDGEYPIFHGTGKPVDKGEYIFAIPKESSISIWKSTLYLLFNERFNLNTPGYEIIGLGWRPYFFNESAGLQLTFFVDYHNQYDETIVKLFLNELRLIIPQEQKQFFKKCVSKLPGSKKKKNINIT